jgi:outer membrane protein
MKNTARHTLAASLIACLGLMGASSAFAQAFDAARIYGAVPERDGGVMGLGVAGGPKFMGSQETRVMALPVIDYQWSNGFFAGTGNGLGINFSKQAHMSYGLRITADFGRDEDLSPALRGMGDINIRPEAGAFLNFNLSPSFVLTSSIRYGSGNDRKGLQLDLGAAYNMALAPQWRAGMGAAMTVANAEYMQSFFGVTQAQSSNSGWAAYKPAAGVRDVRANFSLTYAIDKRMAVTGVVSGRALQGDAKKSPLSQKDNSASGVVAFSYLF